MISWAWQKQALSIVDKLDKSSPIYFALHSATEVIGVILSTVENNIKTPFSDNFNDYCDYTRFQ